MTAPTIRIARLPHGADIALPSYATEGAAGADLRAAISEELTLAPGARALVPTGLVFEIPQGYEVQVRPRSGLAARHGVTVLNTPGTIDSDYRGEVMVLLVNLSGEAYTLAPGDRIAQMVVAPVVRAAFEEAADLSASQRGAGGFGSTGSG
ncbi:dUTP diphosphatase [Aurantimonas sp. VKM B-3413]|uniref:dUTP diphosphatase n=1 Tax=Aurantimonas sp. VKM B-3413 TaxID=2779401 RepID=UPI001E5BA911|nr:dUTP diphosphatase [Aurantimonas sp. VKM B-3413]MCB8838416.1 dUTP diphosphatase [Aurantimonas sp. VKM B-3413]